MDPFSATGTDASGFLTGIAVIAAFTHLAAFIAFAVAFRTRSRERLIYMLRLSGVPALAALAMPFMGFLFTRDQARQDASFDPRPIAHAKYAHGMSQAWTQLGWGLLALVIPALVTAFLWWRLRRLDAANPPSSSSPPSPAPPDPAS